jgi:hypothetical protein
MLNKSLAVLGIILLTNSVGVAAQSTTAPVPAGPRVHSEPVKAPHHKQRLKKHQQRPKKPVTPPTHPTTPPKQ